jgi:hypothetical protein
MAVVLVSMERVAVFTNSLRSISDSLEMKTLPIMIRVEPKKWHAIQREAAKRDRTTPQLVREILNDWLVKARHENRTHNDDDKHPESP